MKVLFVCTGNICRSPMAEAIVRREIQNRGLQGMEVSSAGTGAWEASSASEGAYLVSLENQLDLSSHGAKLLTRELVNEVDIVFTMARHHRRRVEELGGEGKAHVLGEYVGRVGPDAEVADPFESDIDVYRKTFAELEELIGPALDRLVSEHRP